MLRWLCQHEEGKEMTTCIVVTLAFPTCLLCDGGGGACDDDDDDDDDDRLQARPHMVRQK